MDRPRPPTDGARSSVYRPEADEEGITRDFVYAELERGIARKLPHLNLSKGDVFTLSGSIMKIRELQMKMRRLEHSRDSAEELRLRQDELVRELAAIKALTGMSAADFTDALSDDGVTTEEQDKGEVVLETLPDF